MKFKLLALITAVGISLNSFGTKLTLAQIQKLKSSVVRIKSTNSGKIGSGFVYSNAKYIVTAFHVVSGSNGNVTIEYKALGQTRTGKVIKTLKSADLALIEVDNPINVQALNSSSTQVQYDSEYSAIGFLWDAEDYFTIDVKQKETRNLNFLPSKTISDIQTAQCPSLSLNVYTYSGNPLVPGYSGSPVFNSNEEVIAIGDGGIKEGLASVSWGIPSSNLATLMASTQNETGSLASVKSLYAADEIQTSNWEENFLIINGEKFNKTRTEKLQTIASTTDDVNGLNMLLNTFPQQIDKYNIEFDVYQNFTNGAIFILPAGYTYSQQGNSIILKSSNNNVILSIDIEKCNYAQMNPLTIQLEQNQLAPQLGWNWISDPNFTYVYPSTRSDGFMVRRAAFAQLYYNQFNGQTYYNNYFFESFVFKNDLLMYLTVKNFDYNTQYLLNRMPCDQNGFTGLGCNRTLSEITEWMKMVVAVHFATFSK